MYILDIDNSTKKGLIGSIICTIICGIIIYVYSFFSHNAYSDYMTYCFIYPLIGCVLLYFILNYIFHKKRINRVFFNLYNSGIATITVGSYILGIFEIAGSDSDFSFLFNGLGIVLISISLLYLIYDKFHNYKYKILILDKLKENSFYN